MSSHRSLTCIHTFDSVVLAAAVEVAVISRSLIASLPTYIRHTLEEDCFFSFLLSLCARGVWKQ